MAGDLGEALYFPSPPFKLLLLVAMGLGLMKASSELAVIFPRFSLPCTYLSTVIFERILLDSEARITTKEEGDRRGGATSTRLTVQGGEEGRHDPESQSNLTASYLVPQMSQQIKGAHIKRWYTSHTTKCTNGARATLYTTIINTGNTRSNPVSNWGVKKWITKTKSNLSCGLLFFKAHVYNAFLSFLKFISTSSTLSRINSANHRAVPCGNRHIYHTTSNLSTTTTTSRKDENSSTNHKFLYNPLFSNVFWLTSAMIFSSSFSSSSSLQHSFPRRLYYWSLALLHCAFTAMAADRKQGESSEKNKCQGAVLEGAGGDVPRNRRGQLVACSEHETRTCCEVQHDDGIRARLETAASGVSAECLAVSSVVLCSRCDADVGVGQLAQGSNPILCVDLSKRWYDACASSLFSAGGVQSSSVLDFCSDDDVICSPLNEITQDPVQFCKSMGFEVRNGWTCK